MFRKLLCKIIVLGHSKIILPFSPSQPMFRPAPPELLGHFERRREQPLRSATGNPCRLWIHEIPILMEKGPPILRILHFEGLPYQELHGLMHSCPPFIDGLSCLVEEDPLAKDPSLKKWTDLVYLPPRTHALIDRIGHYRHPPTLLKEGWVCPLAMFQAEMTLRFPPDIQSILTVFLKPEIRVKLAQAENLLINGSLFTGDYCIPKPQSRI
jgi:hypothetical protein